MRGLEVEIDHSLGSRHVNEDLAPAHSNIAKPKFILRAVEAEHLRALTYDELDFPPDSHSSNTANMSDNGEVEVEVPSTASTVLPKDVQSEIGSVKLFNKWSYEDVEIRDISLTYDRKHHGAGHTTY
jgi:hypothetical protein